MTEQMDLFADAEDDTSDPSEAPYQKPSMITVASDQSFVDARGGTRLHIYNKGSIANAFDSSVIIASDGAHVNTYDSSVVFAYEQTTVTAYEGSTVHAHLGSSVIALEGSTVYAYENSTVYQYPESNVIPLGQDVRILSPDEISSLIQEAASTQEVAS